MDLSLHAVSEDGDMPWSDSNSMVSDDEFDGPPHSPWQGPLSAVSTAMSETSNARVSVHSQLSPMSNDAELTHATHSMAGHPSYAMQLPSIHAHTVMHSHSASSCTGSWDMGCDDAEDMTGMDENFDNDIHWDQDSDDILTMPKTEPKDEGDLRLDDVQEAPVSCTPSAAAPSTGETKLKRPRGRPRKHPVTPIVTGGKITKGRSKTGCLTCRKRKKKCDEAKPRCMNCEKNAVVCEGYPEKQIWKSGKERAEEERMRLHAIPKTVMQPIFDGLDTAEDMIFWKYYHEHLSNVLTVESEHKNAFKSMMVPIAVKNKGLMHSILSLASKHIDYDTPYVVNLLKKYPKTSVEALKQRSIYHTERAMSIMQMNTAKLNDHHLPRSKDTVAALYGQMLCMVLESRAEGQLGPAYRIHLRAYKALIRDTPPEDDTFQAFVTEFLQYQIFADELLRIPTEHDRRLATEDWEPELPIPQPRLIGVADGLFKVAAEITTLRNEIRERRRFELDTVSYHDLFRASAIDEVIRNWTPAWPAGDSRQRVAQLYLQVLRIYLLRTVYGPRLSPSDSPESDPQGVGVEPTTSDQAAQVFPVFPVFPASPAHTPPHSAPTSASSSPRLSKSAVSHPQQHPDPSSLVGEAVVNFGPPSPRSNPPSRKNSGTGSPTLTAQYTDAHYSPYQAPAHTPVQPSPIHPRYAQDCLATPVLTTTPTTDREPDKKIASAVSAALDLLSAFAPGDPSQTLLLPACLVVGAACWAPEQRERARRAVRAVRGYTGMRNGDTAGRLLDRLWHLMDAGEWEAAWDWQAVARGMGLDFLCA